MKRKEWRNGNTTWKSCQNKCSSKKNITQYELICLTDNQASSLTNKASHCYCIFTHHWLQCSDQTPNSKRFKNKKRKGKKVSNMRQEIWAQTSSFPRAEWREELIKCCLSADTVSKTSSCSQLQSVKITGLSSQRMSSTMLLCFLLVRKVEKSISLLSETTPNQTYDHSQHQSTATELQSRSQTVIVFSLVWTSQQVKELRH